MYDKKNTIIIGDINARKAYAKERPFCECCGRAYGPIHIHHHIKQHTRYLSERYTIESADNYSMLGMYCCHGMIERENQYNLALLPKKGIPFTYWHTLKSGEDYQDVIREFIRKN